jgi:hypothetical protein
MVWLHRSPIPVGRTGVISSFNDPALLHVEEEGGGRHPVLGPPDHREWESRTLNVLLVLDILRGGSVRQWLVESTPLPPQSSINRNSHPNTLYLLSRPNFNQPFTNRVRLIILVPFLDVPTPHWSLSFLHNTVYKSKFNLHPFLLCPGLY